jgi:hypothetical protein
MKTKEYRFTADEMIIIREALGEYKWILDPCPIASDNRKKNYKLASALHEQFANDVRTFKP